MLTVVFRGRMLYVSTDQGKHLDEIVIPDASHDGCHPDNTDARRHYRGMLILEPGSSPRRIDLSTVSRVTIVADGESGHPITLQSYAERVSLNQMANPSPDRNDWITRISNPPNATTIELIGGEMSASGKTEMPLEIPVHGSLPLEFPRQVPILTTWTSQSATKGYFQIDDGQQERIASPTIVYVYHWDHDNPEKEDLTMPINRTTAPHAFEDLDMKWVYTLFQPPASTKGDWTAWLGGEHFPVPHTPGFKAPECGKPTKNPPTSTCDGTSFCEIEPC